MPDPQEKSNDNPSPTPSKCRAPQPSTAARLVSSVRGAGELFHDSRHNAYVALEVGGHRETLPVASKAFQTYLARRAYEGNGSVLGLQGAEEAVGTLTGLARIGPQRDVHVRVAGHENKVYIDLGDSSWRAVEIDADGWRVVPRPPVHFRRSDGMQPLPEPVRCGTAEPLRRLRELLNLREEVGWRLVVAWLLASLRPQGPYPLLSLTGEQGSAKTTTSRALRYIIDPHATPLRGAPRSEQDLVIAAENSCLLAYDNISVVPPWLSDTLCRVSTGAGFSARKLYTDSEEVLISVMRPVLLNGIAAEMVCRPDLLDRTLAVELASIPDAQRRTSAEVWGDLEAVRPHVLGALLDAVSAGLRDLPNVRLLHLPRMADFAKWVEACGPALGWGPGEFVSDFTELRGQLDEQALSLWPVAPVLEHLLEGQTEIECTVGQLLGKLNGARTEMEDEAYTRDWPQTAKALGTELRRYAPNLRRVGVEVTWLKKRSSGCPVRIVKVETAPAVRQAG
jgi:hypothetical protein